MYTRAVFLAGSLMLATGSSSAFAADIYAPSAGGLKDPVISEEIILPEASAFQEYAEWYIRGDVGIGRYTDMDGNGNSAGADFGVNGLDFDNIFSAGVGFGRYITPNIRLGLDVDYRHRSSSTFLTGDPAAVAPLTNLGTIPLELTSTTVMLNAVYDFAPERRWSPYVGGGIGWAFHNLEFNGSSFTNSITAPPALETGTVSSSGSTSSSFAANLVTGVSVNIRKGLFLDVGYKFSYLGDAGMNFNYTHPSLVAGADTSSVIDMDDIMTHEFKIGLRYDLY